jgi:protein-S-isoprenylcysteine O-methyltransferase Ste14
VRIAPQFDLVAALAYGLVLLSVWALGGVAIAGKKIAAKTTVKRDPKSTLGLLVQMAAYLLVYILPRPYFSPFVPMSKSAEAIVAGVAILLAFWSLWFCYAAARALGKQWALMARVIEGHELIVRGPYAVVRNPIYLAMLGTLIAAGLTATTWPVLFVALAIFLIGTWIRISTEEKILRSAFGAQFEEYARHVPAFLPGIL